MNNSREKFEEALNNCILETQCLLEYDEFTTRDIAHFIWQAATEQSQKEIAELEANNGKVILALASIRDIFEYDDEMVMSGALSYPECVADFVKAKIAELEEELQSNKNMFLAACESLGIIAKHLNLEPEQGGHAPILYEIKKFEAQNKAMREALESLVNDLSLRAKIGQKDAQGVVACGNGVWIKANAALDKKG